MRIDELGRRPDRPQCERRAIQELADDVEPEEEEETEGEDDSAAISATLLQLKEDALARFAKINRLYEKMSGPWSTTATAARNTSGCATISATS